MTDNTEAPAYYEEQPDQSYLYDNQQIQPPAFQLYDGTYSYGQPSTSFLNQLDYDQATFQAYPQSNLYQPYPPSSSSSSTPIDPLLSTSGLNIDGLPYLQQTSPSAYSPHSTERPNLHTVANLEEIVANSPPKGSRGQPPTLADRRLPKLVNTNNPLELLPRVDSLALASPRHSLSTASSGSSSVQHSPITPFSAHPVDMSPQYSQGPAYINANHLYYINQSANLNSMPSGFLPQTPSQLTQSGHRQSSSGLMEKVVASRNPLASPEVRSMVDQSAASGLRSMNATPRSSSKSKKSPNLGSCSATRRAGRSASSSTSGDEAHLTLSIGPHRTATKRSQRLQADLEHNSPPTTRSTQLKRSQSDVSFHHSSVQQLDSPYTPHPLARSTAQLQRIENRPLILPKASSEMLRMQSSPLASQPVIDSQGQSSTRRRGATRSRASTSASLQMSQLPQTAQTPPQLGLRMELLDTISALDKVHNFLTNQRQYQSASTHPSIILGTPDQLHFVQDLRSRIVARLESHNA